MKMIITGGAGFIGSNFVQYMVGKYASYDIINVDLLTFPGSLKNLEPIEDRPNYKFVKGDITDRSFVFQLFETVMPDIVVNFAEENHTSRYIADAASFVRANVIGTVTLLEACRKFGIKRYHQVSTERVYDVLTLNGTLPGTFDPYSASKASADLCVQAYYRTFGLPVTISRCSNNYGPYHFPDKFIPMAVIRALADKEVPIYGTGENVCDWLHVSDHCRAVDLILHEGRVGEVYNINGHNERTNLMAVKTILRILDKPESLIRFVTGHKVHERHYAPSSAKLENELGWAVSYDFDSGLRQTIGWYWNHQNWWNNIQNGKYREQDQ
ncbi:dTDP-glucose 4,6-dehydratase [Clostridium sp. Marseille-P2415]|uniref:dTDP-glucose 4,6-dehydratase n=1 Tax=Clostridium sp. Marseille-P2415 TaxID=1805471 RepID=UPI0009885459|nr:dTDP-glucose 4,6-dehydratase [Clostridium sp. Marseille-P2415]